MTTTPTHTADEKAQALGFRDAAHHDNHHAKMAKLAADEDKLLALQRWVFTPSDFISGVPYSARIKAGGKVICLIPDATHKLGSLIAAAPDLLALARDFIRLMECPETRKHVDATRHGAFDYYAKNARAAIAKAEGRA